MTRSPSRFQSSTRLAPQFRSHHRYGRRTGGSLGSISTLLLSTQPGPELVIQPLPLLLQRRILVEAVLPHGVELLAHLRAGDAVLAHRHEDAVGLPRARRTEGGVLGHNLSYVAGFGGRLLLWRLRGAARRGGGRALRLRSGLWAPLGRRVVGQRLLRRAPLGGGIAGRRGGRRRLHVGRFARGHETLA